MEISDNHKQHLLSTFQYIDKLFSDIERILSTEQSRTLFKQYIPDISLRRQEVLEHGITEFRGLMKTVLKSLEIDHPQPHISALRAVLTSFTLVDIAIEELNSKHMRSYGEVSPKASGELDSLINEMQQSIKRIASLMSGVSAGELKGVAKKTARDGAAPSNLDAGQGA